MSWYEEGHDRCDPKAPSWCDDLIDRADLSREPA